MSTTRATVLATLRELAAELEQVMPTSTARTMALVHVASAVARLLSKYDLGEPIDTVAEAAVAQVTSYGQRLVQQPTAVLTDAEATSAAQQLQQVLCRIYDAVVVTVDV